MMFLPLGGSPSDNKCPRCSQSVYWNERVRAVGREYHRWCFKCTQCSNTLVVGRQCEHKGEPYCETCYGKRFGPQGVWGTTLRHTDKRPGGRRPSVPFENPIRFIRRSLGRRSSKSSSVSGSSSSPSLGGSMSSVLAAEGSTTSSAPTRGRKKSRVADGTLASILPDFDVTFLGTGVSTAVPMMRHVIENNDCICPKLVNCPESKNVRNNVSILLRFEDNDGIVRHVMVDCGKTVRASVLNHFPAIGAKGIDALLLTHSHADAIMGLDDIRDLQSMEEVFEENGEHVGYRIGIDEDGNAGLRVLSTESTLNAVKSSFPYLASAGDLKEGDENWVSPGVIARRVSILNFETLPEDAKHFSLFGLQCESFPVLHGNDYVSLGFIFGTAESGYFVYISDVSDIPQASMEVLQGLGNIKYLVVDALRKEKHFAHFSLDESIAFVRTIRPDQAYLVGMSSCELGDHDEVNGELAKLKEEGLHIELAYDGLHLSVEEES